MAVSLPLIFAIQVAFLVAALSGIIASFTAVTNHSIDSIVKQSVLNKLEGLQNRIAANVLFIEPLVRQFAVKLSYDQDYCNNLSRPFASFRRHFADELYLLGQYPGIAYVYQTYYKPGDGLWIDCGCGGGYCEYGVPGPTSWLISDGLPVNMTIFDTNHRDPTNDYYCVFDRNLNDTQQDGAWQVPSVYIDPTDGSVNLLNTFSVPLLFDAAGRSLNVFSIDISLTWLRQVLLDSVVGGGFVYLVDATSMTVFVHSLDFPLLSDSGSAWNATSTPNAEINAAVAQAGGSLGLQSASGSGVFNVHDTIVSFIHLRSGTMHWVAFDHTPRSFYFGESRRLQSILIAVAVIVVALCVGIQIGVFVCVVRPLNDMSTAMDRISKLDETTAAEEQAPALSELGVMHRAYSDLNKAMQSFTRYVPKEVVKDLMMSGQLCEIKMRAVPCAMLFVDIKGFTTLCERVPVDRLGPLIAVYFDRMSALIMHHNGIIDKFIGDCIMAVWGAPFPQDHIQLRAALCALRLHHETRRDPLRSRFLEEGEHLTVRVGAASGRVLAGNMGTDKRMNYTVIGDPVNLAARLESLNKQFGTNVMISESVAQHCHNDLCLRLLHRVAVIGKDVPVEVYEVLGAKPAEEEGEVLVKSVNPDLQSLHSLPSGEFCETPRANHPGRSQRGQDAWKKEYVAAHAIDVDELVAEAQEFCPAPQTEIIFASRFSVAVRSYLRSEFASALEMLNEMDELTGGVYTSHPSVELIVNECERMQANPGASFNGVFVATGK